MLLRALYLLLALAIAVPAKAQLNLGGSGGGALFAQTQTVTVANTASETTITGTGNGTLTLPANFLVAGRTIKFSAFGFHSATANPTIRVRIYAGTSVLLDTGTVTTANSTNAQWDLRGQIVCLTTGVSGTVNGQGFWTEAQAGANIFGMVNTSAVILDTTSSQTLKMTVQWGTASSSDTITMTNFLVEPTSTGPTP